MQDSWEIPGWHPEPTRERVPNTEAVLVTRFRWRAERLTRRLNAENPFPFFRYEVAPVPSPPPPRRWMVVAMQNVAVRDE